MEIFSETLKKLWNLWEIRSLLLLSLSLQIILILFGSRRKITNPHSWIEILLKVIIWCAYISADWVATVALSVMASNVADGSKHDSFEASASLQAFWTPFFLLHLGGPDTITAYSFEDNELWLRHLLGLVVEVGVAFYVFLRFWSNELTFLSVPVFITGILKYGERTWALWSSSTQRFKDSSGLFPVSFRDLFYFERTQQALVTFPPIESKDYNLVQAYFSYLGLRNLFAYDKPVSVTARRHNYSIISEKSSDDAFKLVAIELGLMYDVLYTKADIIYSRFGIYLRGISFVCSVSALVLFSIIIDTHRYPLIDITVTYLLLVGSICLEIYVFMLLLSSNWTRLWLIKLKVASFNQISETLADISLWFTSCLQSCFTNNKWWSESIGQYNLLTSVRKERQRSFLGLEKLPCMSKLLDKYQYLSWADVDISLQERIFYYLKDIADELHQNEKDDFHFRQSLDERLSRKGEYAIKDYRFGDLLVAREYEERIIIWHIVTDECYTIDLDHVNGEAKKLGQNCRISKCLSDYMLYLLLFCPSLLPKGIGQISYEHTYIHVVEGLTYEALLDFYPHSVLESARGLASQLKDNENCWDDRWDMITEVWLEMLAYAAQHFEWKEHARYLRKGGELLTHVSVLMINFRLNKQVM